MPWLLTEQSVIHAHFLAHTAELGAYLGVLNNRIILVVTAHGSDVLMNASPKLIQVARKYDYIVCASSAVFADLTRKSVLFNSKITSSKCVRYCRTHELTPPSDEIPALPAIQIETWRFLSIGRMHPQKGWDICIRLALELKSKSIKFKWTFIGDGYEFERIQRLVYDQGLQNEISLLGRMPRNFCLEMMKESDFTVLPSVITDKDCDGLPLVILEAMRAGSIVISTRVAGIPEAIGEGRGILLDESVENSVEQIVSLMSDSEGRENITKGAKLWVTQNTSIDKSDPLLEVYSNAFRKFADAN
jgi:glycosyltransferase involved in cell wall biosynthesis